MCLSTWEDLFIFLCMDVLPVFMFMHHVNAVPIEAIRGLDPLGLELCSWLLATMHMWEPSSGPLPRSRYSSLDTLKKKKKRLE